MHFGIGRLHRVRSACVWAALASLVSCIAWAVPAAAVPVLDQHFDSRTGDAYTGGPTILSTQRVAQTFTAGIEGTLVTVGVQIYPSGVRPEFQLSLELMDLTAEGRPDDAAVRGTAGSSSLVLPDRDSLDFTLIDVSALGVQVSPGDELAIVLGVVDSEFSPMAFGDAALVPAYTGGTGWSYNTNRSPLEWTGLGINQTWASRPGSSPCPSQARPSASVWAWWLSAGGGACVRRRGGLYEERVVARRATEVLEVVVLVRDAHALP